MARLIDLGVDGVITDYPDRARRVMANHEVMPCKCGQAARYAGRHAKTFVSVLGPLTLSRAYYHCGSCGEGFCPRDRALGLEGGSLSPGVLRMVGRVAAMVSFEE
jgi:hypothetical protein